MRIINRLADHFAKVQPLPVGLYHKQDVQDEKPYRVHLRLRPDGSGIFILNASTVLQLNATAAEYAYHFIHGTQPEEAVKQIASRYRVSKEVARQDYQDFIDRIETLISTPDLDPVSFLDFERAAPHSAALASPLRLDCALTYRLRPDSNADYAPTKRVERELTTEEWRTILDKAWQAGIPQITFTGGEATLRDDLADLIAHAEKNGQVCGLLTDGLRMLDKEYLDSLLQTGLDHILFLLQPENDKSWTVLEQLMAEDIFVTVHLTLNQDNINNVEAILERLAAFNVTSLSLTSSDPSLRDTFDALRDKAATLGLTLKFDLPVPYSSSNPVVYEAQESAVPEGAGKAWLYVEPDGDVLPSQGHSDEVLGNFFRDEWKKIYT
ncbi:MAG TPA: PqqD family peptide modification chaperone [Anaerolineales bacterium]|nr:PqqD family peptide modification chaperone [Anaerolineales bacterium]